MNLLRLLFVVVVAAIMSSCGENVSKNCAQTDWTGTYTGTIACDGDSEAVTVTITASGTDNIVIIHETTGDFAVTTEYDALPPDACELDYSETDTDLGITITIDADLDGDNLTISEVISDGTDASTCNITATRN